MIDTMNSVKPPRMTALNALHEAETGPFSILIGTILSARTKDETTTKTVKVLFSKYKNSKELASIIEDAKKNYKKYKRNPATKTFQAIRIFVNQELTELILGLIEAAKLLSNGGVLIVVSFHSLEDKIVKNFFNLYSNLRKNPSRYLPIKVSKSSLFKQISKKPLVANVKEVNENIRSRSAKLRYAIRNNNSFFYPDEFKKKFVNYLELEGGRI